MNLSAKIEKKKNKMKMQHEANAFHIFLFFRFLIRYTLSERHRYVYVTHVRTENSVILITHSIHSFTSLHL